MNEDRVVQQMGDRAVDTVATLPCDRIKHLIPLVRRRFDCIDISREEVGVGLCAGIALAGKRPAMLIQSTGAATLLNAVCSLTVYYGLPLPMLISWRGHYREGIEAQIPLGRVLPGVFAAAGIETVPVETPEDIHRIGQGIQRAFERPGPVAVLMSPRIFEPEAQPTVSGPETRLQAPEPARPTATPKREKSRGSMKRFDAIRAMAPHLGDAAVVVNIGVPCKEVCAVADGPNVFYMLGSLGMASAIGVGLAGSVRRQVVVIDGDGSLLMTPNILEQVAAHPAGNLTVVAVDNGAYGSTGNQPTVTATQGIDLERLARAYGIGDTAWAGTPKGIEAILSKRPWPRFLHVTTAPGNASVPNVPMAGEEIRSRFMDWLQ